MTWICGMPECRAVRAGLSEVIVDGAKWVGMEGRIRALEAALRECKPQIYSPNSPTHALIEKLLGSGMETKPEFDPAWVCGVCGKRHGQGECLGMETKAEPPSEWGCSHTTNNGDRCTLPAGHAGAHSL